MEGSEEPVKGDYPAKADQSNATNESQSSPVTGSSEASIAKEQAIDCNNKPQEPNPAAKPEPGRFGRTWAWIKDPKHSGAIQAIFTAVIMLTGILYTIFAGLQWSAMKTSNQFNRDALESVQRAFVVFDGTQEMQGIIRDKTGDQVTMIFAAQVENTGSTPAKGIAQRFNGDKLRMEPTEDEFLNGPASRAYLIGPRQRSVFGRVIKPASYILSNADDSSKTRMIDVTKSGTGYFWGWITYRDTITDQIHLTEFCQSISAVSKSLDSRTGVPFGNFVITFDSCTHHNCSDKDCEDYQRVASIPPEERPVTPKP